MKPRQNTKRNEWIQILTNACQGLNNTQIDDILHYCRWVMLRKVNDEFEEIFTKHK